MSQGREGSQLRSWQLHRACSCLVTKLRLLLHESTDCRRTSASPATPASQAGLVRSTAAAASASAACFVAAGAFARSTDATPARRSLGHAAMAPCCPPAAAALFASSRASSLP